MAGKKITVVISQSQGKNPVKRQMEEELAAALIMEPDVDLSLVPHLYDMSKDHTGLLFLQSIPGELVILSWLYPRAARWVLNRQGIKGREGISLLKSGPVAPVTFLIRSVYAQFSRPPYHGLRKDDPKGTRTPVVGMKSRCPNH